MISFKLFNVQIRIEFMFVGVVTLFLLADKTGISILALIACIIHESGHLIMFFIVGHKPTALAFEITGIRLTKPYTELSYTKELLVQLAGSFTNLAVFCSLLSSLSSINKISIFAVINLVIGIFNLIPVKSFDGGKIFEMLALKLFTVKTATSICTLIDAACIAVMLFFTIYSFISGNRSITMIIITVYLMLTALLKLNRKQQ